MNLNYRESKVMDAGPFRTLALTLGTDSARSAVVGAVNKLLRKCGQLSPPIELRPITEELGIHVEWTKIKEEGARGVASLSSDGEQFIVKFFERELVDNWRRTRFTVAHEIIHTVILKILADPLLIAELDETADNHKALERLCDIGAAELLMPKTLFRQYLSENVLTPNKLRELYDEFMVSREALFLRIAETLPRGSVTRWRKYARNQTESECFRVVASYPNYSATGKNPWLPVGATSKHVVGFPLDLHQEYDGSLQRKRSLRLEIDNKHWEGQGYFTRWPDERLVQPAFRGFSVPDEVGGRYDSDFYLIFSE